MSMITINCEGVESEREFWDRYLQAVKTEGSGYFGRNLDAFNDALAGGPGCPGEHAVRFINVASLRTLREGAFFSALVEIAKESEFCDVSFE